MDVCPGQRRPDSMGVQTCLLSADLVWHGGSILRQQRIKSVAWKRSWPRPEPKARRVARRRRNVLAGSAVSGSVGKIYKFLLLLPGSCSQCVRACVVVFSSACVCVRLSPCRIQLSLPRLRPVSAAWRTFGLLSWSVYWASWEQRSTRAKSGVSL